jgi:hypothetical protein
VRHEKVPSPAPPHKGEGLRLPPRSATSHRLYRETLLQMHCRCGDVSPSPLRGGVGEGTWPQSRQVLNIVLGRPQAAEETGFPIHPRFSTRVILLALPPPSPRHRFARRTSPRGERRIEGVAACLFSPPGRRCRQAVEGAAAADSHAFSTHPPPHPSPPPQPALSYPSFRRRTDRVTCRCGREEALSFAAGTCGRGGRGVESGGAKSSAGQASPFPGFAGSVWVRHASRCAAHVPESAKAVSDKA